MKKRLKNFGSVVIGLTFLSFLSQSVYGEGDKSSQEVQRSKKIEKAVKMEEKAKSFILKEIPYGTSVQEALEVLNSKLKMKYSYEPRSGIILPEGRINKNGKGMIGKKSITITYAREAHPSLPIIEYLFVKLGFDEKDELIAVEAVTEIDAP